MLIPFISMPSLSSPVNYLQISQPDNFQLYCVRYQTRRKYSYSKYSYCDKATLTFQERANATWQMWWCLWQTRGGGRVKAGPCCCRNEKDVRISQLTFYNRFEFRTRFTWTPHSNCVSSLPPLFCVLLGLHTCTSTSSLHSLTKSLCNLNQFWTHFTSFWISAIVFGKNVSLGVFWTVSP